MKQFERIAYLKYLKKLVEQEIEQEQNELGLLLLDYPVQVDLGKLQSQTNNSYTFDNSVVSEVTGHDMFLKIAKVSKKSLESVLNPKELALVMSEGMSVEKSSPFLKLVQVHYPAAKMAVKIGNKFRTIFKLS